MQHKDFQTKDLRSQCTMGDDAYVYYCQCIKSFLCPKHLPYGFVGLLFFYSLLAKTNYMI